MDPSLVIYETKRTLKTNLIIGAVIGAALAGLIAFLLLSPAVDGDYFNYALANGATEFEAGTAIAVFLAVACPCFSSTDSFCRWAISSSRICARVFWRNGS